MCDIIAYHVFISVKREHILIILKQNRNLIELKLRPREGWRKTTYYTLHHKLQLMFHEGLFKLIAENMFIFVVLWYSNVVRLFKVKR